MQFSTQAAYQMEVERAIGDVRRGVPVIVAYEGRHEIVYPEEYGAEGVALQNTAHPGIKLMKLAGLLPRIVVASIGSDEDTHLLTVSEEAITQYNAINLTKLSRISEADVPLRDALNAHVIAYRPRFGHEEHLAVCVGEIIRTAPVLVRIHSACVTGDILGSLRCDCGDQLHDALAMMAAANSGILLYLAQEGRGIGIANKLRAYKLQDQGMDTSEANETLGYAPDERDFAVASAILQDMGIKEIRLLTNNPHKVAAMQASGIIVKERCALPTQVHPHNEKYLRTKKEKFNHW